MKILLVGEYSRLHNSLKEGLESLKHQVVLISTGDYFKNYPSDIKIKRKFESGFLKKIKIGIFLVTKIDLTSLSIKKQVFKHKDKLKGFDVVQLINESSFGINPAHEKQIISYLNKNNKKLFLLSCGTDYSSVSYALGDHLPYSILEGYKNGTIHKKKYDFALKYTQPSFVDLHNYLFSKIEGVIASDLDYHLPLKNHPKYLGLIPNPINLEKLQVTNNPINKKITIFLGINKNNEHTKGIHYFKKALAIIDKKYADKIQLKIVENLSYDIYIKIYDKAHIILDQVLGLDQGYNALEAMSKGKLVFTGAGKEFEKYYKLSKKIAINAEPNAQKIAEALEHLILHPEKIIEIGNNARKFIEQEHDYKKIAQKYVDTWTK